MLKINCAAMAEPLLESELFGHEAGAFTGATGMHRGRFERADGGTLFLDELGTMSQRLQEKLLRLVEYGEFERLGGQRTLQADVRVVAATNADLPELAAQGTFRADLLDRLSFDVVHLPPLRVRREDIAELAEHFAIGMSAELGWSYFPGFSDRAAAMLAQHDWPGNVRELKNVVERSLHRWGDALNEVDDIVINPFARPWETATIPPAAAPLAATRNPAAEEVATGVPATGVPATGMPATGMPATGVPATTSAVTNFTEQMASVERELLSRALAEHGHHQRRTAKALGLSYNQMRGLVRKHGLSRKRRG